MLAEALEALSEQALEVIEQHNTERRETMIRVLKVCPVLEHFEYNSGSLSYDLSNRYVEREEWPIGEQYRFVQNVLSALDSFPRCLEEIVKLYGIAREHAEPRLARYLQVLAIRYAAEGEHLDPKELISTFIDDLDGSQIKWTVKGAIRGVVLEADKHEFGHYRLRRPIAGDLEIEEPVNTASPAALRNPLLEAAPSAFMEFETRAKGHYAVKQEYQHLVDLLRLFRLGSVSSVALTSMPSSIVHTGGTLYSITQKGSAYCYELRESDRVAFARFMNRNWPCLAKVDSAGSRDNDVESICLAHERYKNAVLGSGEIEWRVISAITCLESLFLRAAGDSGVGDQLARRVSTLLGFYGKNPHQAYDEVGAGYAVRDGYLNGFELSESQRQALFGIDTAIMEYARISLVVFLQLAENLNKTVLIRALDDSLVSAEAAAKVAQRLQEDTDIPL